ncbi:hypothetical protein NliqN6_3474 [Naganishia liquefaciens]|uniref:Uncharacterized protein n=1 Tax=Naganishia liquefaciens TaxID=104408 RepID=A0A8H3YGB7_9TREE|nr:hypothetical protein NliqN6_3474 [Naganishia liquefaciens]
MPKRSRSPMLDLLDGLGGDGSSVAIAWLSREELQSSLNDDRKYQETKKMDELQDKHWTTLDKDFLGTEPRRDTPIGNTHLGVADIVSEVKFTTLGEALDKAECNLQAIQYDYILQLSENAMVEGSNQGNECRDPLRAVFNELCQSAKLASASDEWAINSESYEQRVHKVVKGSMELYRNDSRQGGRSSLQVKGPDRCLRQKVLGNRDAQGRRTEFLLVWYVPLSWQPSRLSKKTTGPGKSSSHKVGVQIVYLFSCYRFYLKENEAVARSDWSDNSLTVGQPSQRSGNSGEVSNRTSSQTRLRGDHFRHSGTDMTYCGTFTTSTPRAVTYETEAGSQLSRSSSQSLLVSADVSDDSDWQPKPIVNGSPTKSRVRAATRFSKRQRR